MPDKTKSPDARIPRKSKKPSGQERPPVREPAYERGDLRNALVLEGRRMFEESGASELSLRALARRLGVSEAAPSRHFSSKDDLLEAIARSGFEELAEQRKQISARKLAAFPAAREMMLSYVKYAQDHAGLFDLMTGPRLMQAFRRGDMERSSDVSYSFFANSVFDLALENGWPRKQLHHLSHAAWSMEHGVAALILAARTPRTDSGLDTQRMIEFSIDLFLTGVVAGPTAFGSLHNPGEKDAEPCLERGD
jgi:AcrR family transcriptional regulator